MIISNFVNDLYMRDMKKCEYLYFKASIDSVEMYDRVGVCIDTIKIGYDNGLSIAVFEQMLNDNYKDCTFEIHSDVSIYAIYCGRSRITGDFMFKIVKTHSLSNEDITNVLKPYEHIKLQTYTYNGTFVTLNADFQYFMKNDGESMLYEFPLDWISDSPKPKFDLMKEILKVYLKFDL